MYVHTWKTHFPSPLGVLENMGCTRILQWQHRKSLTGILPTSKNGPRWRAATDTTKFFWKCIRGNRSQLNWYFYYIGHHFLRICNTKKTTLTCKQTEGLKPQLTWERQQSSQHNLFNPDTSVQNKKNIRLHLWIYLEFFECGIYLQRSQKYFLNIFWVHLKFKNLKFWKLNTFGYSSNDELSPNKTEVRV